MARATRDLTVVVGWPSAAAISVNVRSSSKRRDSTARSRGSNRSRASARRRAWSPATRASPGSAALTAGACPRSRRSNRARRLRPRRAVSAWLTIARRDPGREAIGVPHRAGRLQQLEQHPLAQVLRLRQVAGDPVGDPHQRTLPAPHQDREGRPVAHLEPRDQLGVALTQLGLGGQGILSVRESSPPGWHNPPIFEDSSAGAYQ